MQSMRVSDEEDIKCMFIRGCNGTERGKGVRRSCFRVRPSSAPHCHNVLVSKHFVGYLVSLLRVSFYYKITYLRVSKAIDVHHAS